MFLSAVLAAPASAGEAAFFADWNGPAIVDRGASLDPALAAQLRSRPVLRSQQSAQHIAAFANVRIDRKVELACGSRTPERLVVCLDADGRLPPADELAVLARVRTASSIEVGSIRTHVALVEALKVADTTTANEPVVTAFPDCTGACEDRVVIRNLP